MAASTFVDEPADVIGLHIVKTPGVMGGRARIQGTRISVTNVVTSCRVEGWSPEEYQANFDWVSLADIYASFAYYYDHREELEAQLVEDDEFAERFRREHPDTVFMLPE